MRKVRPDAFSLVCEVPYFSLPGIGDVGPSGISRREAIAQGLDHADRALGVVGRAIAELTLDSDPSRIARSLLAYVDKTPKRLTAQRAHLSATEFDREATRAEAVDAAWGPVFYHTMYVGEALRVANAAGAAAVASVLRAEIEQVDTRLRSDAGLEYLELRQLVRCQAGAALIALTP